MLPHKVKGAITKSPVLLPCYSKNMTRLQCNNWMYPAPFPTPFHMVATEPSHLSLSSASQSMQLASAGSSLPHFVKVSC
ncbi:hypothetical protein DPMN_103032 [Dreissena polymorpha]|uniref:Uncharacterized protein n=1 Tax=Dreissena polymorpha TaxID=45954 RepID=A0A9D4K2I1_DREPO|nr:hypothetical protein DPMN_103032 [Dreissena polymorpha]